MVAEPWRSPAAATLFGEAEQPQAAALLQARALCVPHLADCEIANVALKKLRRERLPEGAVLACLEAYSALGSRRQRTNTWPGGPLRRPPGCCANSTPPCDPGQRPR